MAPGKRKQAFDKYFKHDGRKLYRRRMAAPTNVLGRRMRRPRDYNDKQFVKTLAVKGYTPPLYNKTDSYMPYIYGTRLVWHQKITMSTGGATFYEKFYRGNSIYDPDPGAGGHPCLGHTELGAMYGKYRVYGSRITVKFVPTTVTNTLTCIVRPTRSTAGAATQMQLELLPQQCKDTLTVNHDYKELKAYAGTAAMYNTRTADDVAFSSNWNADPTNMWYWDVAVSGTAGDVAVAEVHIEYFVLCFLRQVTEPDPA